MTNEIKTRTETMTKVYYTLQTAYSKKEAEKIFIDVVQMLKKPEQ